MKGGWDCIVVGGGAAGLSAALTLGRARQRTLLIDAGEPSNRTAEGMGGLLGHDGQPPGELYSAGHDELSKYSSVEVRMGRVTGGTVTDDSFQLELQDGSHETARKVLLAMGMDYRHPELPGAGERWGRSVFHCPFCHGWEVRDKQLGVLDHSPRAAERALLLRFWSDDVTLFTNGNAAMEAGDVERLMQAKVIIDERVVVELRGAGNALEAVVFEDGTERGCEGLLVPAPMFQRSPLAAQLGARLADADAPIESVEVDPMFRTTVHGLYAAGDVSATTPPSVATAIAAGSTPAKAIVHDLVEELYPKPVVAADAASS
jgi:thioredoxin reductase